MDGRGRQGSGGVVTTTSRVAACPSQSVRIRRVEDLVSGGVWLLPEYCSRRGLAMTLLCLSWSVQRPWLMTVAFLISQRLRCIPARCHETASYCVRVRGVVGSWNNGASGACIFGLGHACARCACVWRLKLGRLLLRGNEYDLLSTDRSENLSTTDWSALR